MFLRNHEESLGNVTYLQITPKYRSEIPEYFELADDRVRRRGASTENMARFHGRRSATLTASTAARCLPDFIGRRASALSLPCATA